MTCPQSAPVARSLAMYRDPLTGPIKVRLLVCLHGHKMRQTCIEWPQGWRVQSIGVHRQTCWRDSLSVTVRQREVDVRALVACLRTCPQQEVWPTSSGRPSDDQIVSVFALTASSDAGVSRDVRTINAPLDMRQTTTSDRWIMFFSLVTFLAYTICYGRANHISSGLVFT